MNMKADVDAVPNGGDATDTAGEETIISWSLFASLDELRRAPAVPEPAEAAVQPAPAEAQPAAGQDTGGNLQSALGQYTEWLSTFNR
jgi:hypothetical protein